MRMTFSGPARAIQKLKENLFLTVRYSYILSLYFICGRSCDSKNKEISSLGLVGSDNNGCDEKKKDIAKICSQTPET